MLSSIYDNTKEGAEVSRTIHSQSKLEPINNYVHRYIKHLNIAKQPWLADSEFAQLNAESRTWYESLPTSLQFTPSAIYIRKETSQLGALFALHYMYHQNMCDLHRIAAPALYKLRSPFIFPPEQTRFLNHLREVLFYHAQRHAMMTAEAMRHGPHALADSWIPTLVYDNCRILLYYLIQLIDPNTETSRKLIAETLPLVRSNIKALNEMKSMYSVAELLTNAAEKMLDKVENLPTQMIPRQSIIPDEPYPNEDDEANQRSAPGTPVQSAPDYVLNPLSIYRMVRKTIPEKHQPERQPNATSPVGGVASRNSFEGRGEMSPGRSTENNNEAKGRPEFNPYGMPSVSLSPQSKKSTDCFLFCKQTKRDSMSCFQCLPVTHQVRDQYVKSLDRIETVADLGIPCG